MKHAFTLTLCAGLISCATPPLLADEEQTAVAPTQELANVAMDQSAGCLTGEIEQFGRYLGDWNIQDWQMARDGSGWQEQGGARWNFVCVGDGVAVQDFWMPAGGGVGTNLRVYNSATKSWDVTWAATALVGTGRINAKEDAEGNIVMRYVAPKQTPDRRITFYPPDEAGWDWKLELSNDEGETWFDAYKIRATPRS